jgi:hypothetical protein
MLQLFAQWWRMQARNALSGAGYRVPGSFQKSIRRIETSPPPSTPEDKNRPSLADGLITMNRTNSSRTRTGSTASIKREAEQRAESDE